MLGIVRTLLFCFEMILDKYFEMCIFQISSNFWLTDKPMLKRFENL